MSDILISSLKGFSRMQFSASRMELGENAGAVTWNNAKRQASNGPEVMTSEQCEAFREDIRAWGAWDKEEIDAMSQTELRALFIQHVMSEAHEAGADCLEDIDFDKYEEDASAGRLSGFLYKDSMGDIWASVNE
jgi:hypothetical protein